MAYTVDNEAATRPVTFTFNGGPGSSSVWLHLGAFGPRRVKMDDEGQPIGPPYELVDNEATILDLTDLVFIDPVTTGYSRAVPDEDPKQFHVSPKAKKFHSIIDRHLGEQHPHIQYYLLWLHALEQYVEAKPEHDGENGGIQLH